LQAKRIIIAGVSSSGKTTVAQALAGRIGARFLDADDFHPQANVDKMAGGVPLEDADRWPWLDRLNEVLRQAAAQNESVVLACSALKQSYRKRLAADVDGVQLVLLTGSRQLLAARAGARQHRYMPPSLLDSQLATLEPLEPGSGWEIDVTPAVADVVEELARRLEAAPALSLDPPPTRRPA
jgi:carbohydrate kinase (thermoresistant glucokinase family)